VDIGKFVCLFLIIIFGIVIIQPVFAEVNYYIDVRLGLDDIETRGYTSSTVLILEIGVTNNGNEAIDVATDHFLMEDKNSRQYSVSTYDCPFYQSERLNPGISEEFTLCYDLPKEWLNYQIILYSFAPDYCDISSYFSCTNTKSLKLSEVYMESTGAGTRTGSSPTQQGSFSPSQFQKNWYNIYIDELPSWASFANNAVYDATESWKDANPEMEFYVATTRQEADFAIQWVKDFGGEQHAGYAYGRQFIEVGLGDSNCHGNWQPYSSDHVTEILKHELGHIFGHEHSSDSDSIMYPIIQNVEYGLVEDEFNLAPNYGQFVGFCTSKENTSFNYHVETDDPTHGFDVYVVPSQNEFNQFIEGGQFKHYSGNGCFAKNKISFSGVCDGVSIGSGVLIIIPETQTNALTKITLELEESPFTSGKLQKITSQEQAIFYPSPEDKDIKELTNQAMVERYQKINDLKQKVSQTTDSLSGLVFEDKSAQGIIDKAWESNYYVQESINLAEKKYGNVEYELEKGDYGTALELFKEMDSALKTANTYHEMMISDISQAKEIGNDIPTWVRTNAKWWADGITSDEEFVTSIQYLVENGIIRISDLPSSSGETQNEIPDWLRQNVGWWSEGQLSDGEFVSGIKWLIEKGIIRV